MKTLFERLPEKEKEILMKESFERTMVIDSLKHLYYVSEMPLETAYHLTRKLYGKLHIDLNQLFNLFEEKQ